MKRRLSIGSRGSQLALAQTRGIAADLNSLYPDLNIDIRVIKTTGDKLTTASLVALAGDTKGLFVKEIEEALLEGKIDLAVHSLKDLPTELPRGLALGILPRREDPRDALLARDSVKCLNDLPEGARIGTSSLRREIQLRRLRPDLRIESIRGNVDTRIRKLQNGDFDAILLAVAGLRRLGLEEHISYVFPVEELIPAIGQGALAVEVRDDAEILDFLAPLDHDRTRQAVEAERNFLLAMGGGCQVPMGAHAIPDSRPRLFHAFVSDTRGNNFIGRTFEGTSDLGSLSREAAEFFRSRGADLLISGAAE